MVLTAPQINQPVRAVAHVIWQTGYQGGEGRGMEVDPLHRLMYLRQHMLTEATHAARRNGRTPRVALYVCTEASDSDPGPVFDRLRAVARTRGMRAGTEFTDGNGPTLRGRRGGFMNALEHVQFGFADGILCPTYEHVSPDLEEYEEVLRSATSRRWFVALAVPETGG